MSHEKFSQPTRNIESQNTSINKQQVNSAWRAVKRFVAAGMIVGWTYGPASEMVFEYKNQDKYESARELVEKEEGIKKHIGELSRFDQGTSKLQKLDEIKKEHREGLFKSAETITCPICGGEHPSGSEFCTNTGEKIEGYIKLPEKYDRIVLEDLPSRDGKITKEEIRDYLMTLPKYWVSRNVRKMVYSSEERKMHYGGLEDEYALASFSSAGSDRGDIYFYSGSSDSSVLYIIEAINHEIAHANDWDNRKVPYEDRVDLFLAVLNRIQEHDRFLSTYVESIDEENQHEENYNRATEYWAEIAAQYFTDPSQLHIDDFEIVDSFVKKIAPDYDWKNELKNRETIAARIVK